MDKSIKDIWYKPYLDFRVLPLIEKVYKLNTYEWRRIFTNIRVLYIATGRLHACTKLQ